MVKRNKAAGKTGKGRKAKALELEKEEDSSSTLSSDTECTESSTSSDEGVVEEGVDIFDIILKSASGSMQGEEEEEDEIKFPDQKSLYSVVNFFDGFEELVDIKNVSPDISVVAIIPPAADVPPPAQDAGKFVDPLTGLSDGESSKSSKSEEQCEEQIVSKSTSDSDLLYIPGASVESIWLLSEEDLTHEIKPAAVADTLEVFMEFQLDPGVKEDDELDFEAIARAEEVKKMHKNTKKFLTDLINEVVRYVEYLSPQKFLKQNLDKRKLISELADTVQRYHDEKNECDYLNRQVVLHLRRKRSFRAIMEDNPKTLVRDQQKLIEAKERLDRNLATETKLVNETEKLRQELKRDYIQLKIQAKTEIESFESKVRKHLQRDSWPKLNAEVDRLLLIMKTKRQEISEVRFSLFLRQHTAAKLEDLIEKMEDLGNGFTLKGFTTFQAENQVLDKKIEERSTDLNKLYLRCHNDIHTMSHYRKKQQMLNDAVEAQRALLANLIDEKRRLREHLFSLKLHRNQIHSKIKKLGAQGGLLDKPDLMQDYDNTAKLYLEKKEHVDFLRRTMSWTQNKIDAIIQRCPT